MKAENCGGGIGFGGLLFITFLVLKLCHVIDWSWWWVTIPLWGPVALLIVIFTGFGLALLASYVKEKKRCRRGSSR